MLAARLYYEDGLPQGDVARMVNVSQAKVSRMLSRARERGIVRITVQPYESRARDLEEAIRGAFGLKSVIVIKAAGDLPVEQLRKTIGHFAAADVATAISDGAVLAVAGSRVLRELADVLPLDGRDGLTVVQAMGNVDASVGPYDALELARTIAGRSRASLLVLNTPAIVPDRATRKSLLGLDSVRIVKKRLSRATVALVGVGTLDNSVFIERGVLKGSDLEQLRRIGAVGEICGRFFDAGGRECRTPLRERVISIELDELRRTPDVIGVVCGGDRSAAIVAAVRGGLLKSLVIDEGGAAALLECYEGRRATRSSRRGAK